jgi:hypothetical protein
LLDALGDRLALVGGRLAEHVVDDLGLDAGVADAEAQAPEAGLAELRLDVLQAVVTRGAAAELQLGLPGIRSSSSWTTRISSGAILKKRASADTDLPDRFMKVIGSSSHNGRSAG